MLASQNRHKLEELRSSLPGWELGALEAGGWPEETGETYYENALIKARFGREHADPTVWVLGEDSGIEAVALDGAPGLHSARWAPGLDQADGGTRCAAICGAYVALTRALDRFGLAKAILGSVAAVSVGVVEGEPLLDLEYVEDSNADVDLNVVMTGDGQFVEVQATAEREPFDRDRLDELLDLAAGGIEELAQVQRAAIDVSRD